MTTLSIRNSVSRSPLRLGLPRVQRIWLLRGFVLIPLVLACFALSPMAQAVIPAPDGGYPGGNTAEGTDALFSLTTDGNNNTAIGGYALYSNTTGDGNTANGYQALAINTTGNNNTATGNQALQSNTTGSYNTASGVQALFGNTTGASNTANGFQALAINTTGSNNTANGYHALLNNTGSGNVGLGTDAGKNLTTGSGNVCIGVNVLGVAGESNTTRIRNVYSSVASGRAVYVNSNNKIGTLVSSRRFKEEIKLMDKASEALLALKPVTFRYKKEIEPNGAIMFGLIAEEVEKVDPDLVTRNDKGEVETVRYDAVNAMLLNEFLKEHREVAELKSTVAEQRKGMEAMAAQLKEQASQIQKVSAQLELSKCAPKTVKNAD
jgi:trimeric autotransporter adhesin